VSPKPVPGTPSWLRETNDRTALALLLEHGVLTRTRIGELSGLSKPTAAQMVARLETAGLIHAVGEVSGGRGPNAASYAVRTDRVLGVAIDINYLVMRATVVDPSGHEHPTISLTLSRSARERADRHRRSLRRSRRHLQRGSGREHRRAGRPRSAHR
jgi:DNA-binding Lrp family transcriptional regulator